MNPPSVDHGQRYILCLRHNEYKKHFFDVIYIWTAKNFPELLPHFMLQQTPLGDIDWSVIKALVPWLQDPVKQWSMETYTHVCRLMERCDSLGIPVINRVDRLLNASKSIASRLIAADDIRTAKVVPITNHDEFRDTLMGLTPPLFVREDWGHGGAMIRAESRAEALTIPLREFVRPVAVEFIDVRDEATGYYRKYRYFAAGDFGVAQHLQVTNTWISRGEERVRNDQTRDEEIEFVSKPDANHARLQAARRRLGLDIAAFDYGYDRDGRLVVWECNPAPYIMLSKQGLTYRNTALHRSYAAILAFYMMTAGMTPPQRCFDAINYLPGACDGFITYH